MVKTIQQSTRARGAVKIAGDIERRIRDGGLAPGQSVPPVRDLAHTLGVNPSTVAAAYRALQARGLLIARGRRGTRVTHRPLAAARRPPIAPRHAVNLADGNPDPALLPAPGPGRRGRALYAPRLYGEPIAHSGLVRLMRREMADDGVCIARDGSLCVVNGTMDGLDRLLAESLRPGDVVAVEDPGFSGHHDLVASRGLVLAPVAVDDEGMRPDALVDACAQGARAVLITPRAHSPCGATISAERAADLRRILRANPDVLVIEDDHASFLSSTPFHRLHEPRGRWAHLRSLSKSFNPDLRVAVMAGDEQTMTRIIDRLVVVERWVSHILQAMAFALLSDRTVRAAVRSAGRVYDERRESVMRELRRFGLQPSASSGYNVWLGVDEETPTVQALERAGWAVAAGERFRLKSPPGIRITASRLQAGDARRFAGAIADILRPSHRGPGA